MNDSWLGTRRLPPRRGPFILMASTAPPSGQEASLQPTV